MNLNQNKTKHFVQSDDISIAVYEWGKSSTEKQTMVLIHGYPDSAEVWDGLASILAKDFHVVTYDMRGTGQSSVPSQKTQYHFNYLMNDLSQVIDSVSPNQAVHLLGHDWGALQGWEAILDDRLKAKVKSYTALAPSLDAVGMWFRDRFISLNPLQHIQGIKQMVSSSYMVFFNLPVIPEFVWKIKLAEQWSGLVSIIEKKQVIEPSHQLKNGINGLELYRKNLIKPLLLPKKRYTSVPVHLLVMKKDPFVPLHLFENQAKWIKAPVARTEINASHWGILSRPEMIAPAIKQYVNTY
ncbi:alpha/beta fold hydrolase [Acinetobacter sp. WU_MDCI_Axc73]|nr:alpha/beta fold hydrolase [Acinetobacter sp. WU_MDCI_Axc73]